jgi:hypothetical protein
MRSLSGSGPMSQQPQQQAQQQQAQQLQQHSNKRSFAPPAASSVGSKRPRESEYYSQQQAMVGMADLAGAASPPSKVPKPPSGVDKGAIDSFSLPPRDVDPRDSRRMMSNLLNDTPNGAAGGNGAIPAGGGPPRSSYPPGMSGGPGSRHPQASPTSTSPSAPPSTTTSSSSAPRLHDQPGKPKLDILSPSGTNGSVVIKRDENADDTKEDDWMVGYGTRLPLTHWRQFVSICY